MQTEDDSFGRWQDCYKRSSEKCKCRKIHLRKLQAPDWLLETPGWVSRFCNLSSAKWKETKNRIKSSFHKTVSQTDREPISSRSTTQSSTIHAAKREEIEAKSFTARSNAWWPTIIITNPGLPEDWRVWWDRWRFSILQSGRQFQELETKQ